MPGRKGLRANKVPEGNETGDHPENEHSSESESEGEEPLADPVPHPGEEIPQEPTDYDDDPLWAKLMKRVPFRLASQADQLRMYEKEEERGREERMEEREGRKKEGRRERERRKRRAREGRTNETQTI